MRLSAWHLIILLVVVLVIFGYRRLPDIASSMARSLRVFRREIADPVDETPEADRGDAPRA